jgi:sialate O-acetylesterase
MRAVRLALLHLLLCGLSAAVSAWVALPDHYGDNMVLQRDKQVVITGWSGLGTEITLQLIDLETGRALLEATTIADEDGNWEIRLPAQPAGGPYEILVSGGGGRERLENVLFGDVWVASGQSNMRWTVANSMNAAEEIAAADLPEIRLFDVTESSREHPQAAVFGEWRVAEPQNVGQFSAAAFYFARELHRRTGIPQGIVSTNVGGTPVESWMPRNTLREIPGTAARLSEYLKTVASDDHATRVAEYERALEEWNANAYPRDPGNEGVGRGYTAPDFDDSYWPTMTLPGMWEQGLNLPIDGAVWFRKRVDIPEEWVGKNLRLTLGAIDDFDTTYVDGLTIGMTGPETERFWAVQRDYTIPSAIVNDDELVLAVRVFDRYGGGGFSGAPKDLAITGPDGERIELAGEWRAQLEQEVTPMSQETLAARPRRPIGPGDTWAPGGLYNGMVDALTDLNVAGFLWYQGESNAGYPTLYGRTFPALIKSWRQAWNDSSLPFYFVQLANFDTPFNWGWIRESQEKALQLPHTGMVTTIDIGDSRDIHPRNKQEVGRRLALHALADYYGRDVRAEGPRPFDIEFVGGLARIYFAEELKVTEIGGAGFEVAGPDGQFVPATSTRVFHGQDPAALYLEVEAEGVSDVRHVRYAWQSDPKAVLIDLEGLPVPPFRTDDQPAPDA